jgi:UDP-glucuronate decarboxylase
MAALPYSDRCVLVTGAAGFVGSHLVDRLLAQGARVIALDNFSTGSLANVSHHLGNARFRLLRHDVETPLPVTGRVDLIFHLAACASPEHYQREPVKTTLTNVLGTRHALDLAQRRGARLLLASTSEVYGDPEQHPQREDYRGAVNTLGPRACYDEGKRCAETLAGDYARTRGVDVRIARIFNTYGPRMSVGDGRVVSNFVVQALRGEALTVYGRGEQTRSFCYVDDLIDGLLALAASDETRPVNLGNPGEVSMLELAERVRAATGRAAPLAFRPLPADDPKRRCPDIGRATEQLQWRPRVPLERGLALTVAWFRRALRRETQRVSA